MATTYVCLLLPCRRGPNSNTTYTYSEVLLQPAAAALNDVVTNETVVEMALGGEQGRSVFGYPEAYMDMVVEARSSIPNAKKVMAGVSFNYDKVSIDIHHQHNSTYSYRSWRLAGATDEFCSQQGSLDPCAQQLPRQLWVCCDVV